MANNDDIDIFGQGVVNDDLLDDRTIQEILGEVLKSAPQSSAFQAALAKRMASRSPIVKKVPSIGSDVGKLVASSQQLAQLQQRCDDWIAVGKSTDPTDRRAVERGLRNVYADDGLKPPEIEWYESPIQGALAAIEKKLPFYPAWKNRTKFASEAVFKRVSSKTLAEIRLQTDFVSNSITDIGALVGCEIADRVAGRQDSGDINQVIMNGNFGSHDAGQLVYYEYLREVLDMVDCAPLRGMAQIARVGGWYFTFNHLVIATDRPTSIKFDDKGRLHCQDGPAIEYADGFGVCAWHGVRVPFEAILSPSTVNWDVLAELSTGELREALVEIKALNWSGGDQERYHAALATNRLGGALGVRDLIEDDTMAERARAVVTPLLDKIELKRWPWKIVLSPTSVGQELIFITETVPDRDSGEIINLAGMEYGLPPKSLKREEMIEWIYKQLQKHVLHELAEAFHFDGVRIFDPHAGERK